MAKNVFYHEKSGKFTEFLRKFVIFTDAYAIFISILWGFVMFGNVSKLISTFS